MAGSVELPYLHSSRSCCHCRKTLSNHCLDNMACSTQRKLLSLPRLHPMSAEQVEEFQGISGLMATCSARQSQTLYGARGPGSSPPVLAVMTLVQQELQCLPCTKVVVQRESHLCSSPQPRAQADAPSTAQSACQQADAAEEVLEWEKPRALSGRPHSGNKWPKDQAAACRKPEQCQKP